MWLCCPGATQCLCCLDLSWAELGHHVSKYIIIAPYTHTFYRSQPTYMHIFFFVLYTFKFLIARRQCFNWKIILEADRLSSLWWANVYCQFQKQEQSSAAVSATRTEWWWVFLFIEKAWVVWALKSSIVHRFYLHSQVSFILVGKESQIHVSFKEALVRV